MILKQSRNISRGKKAAPALRCLFNVKNKEDAFRILDRKYGDVEMIMPQIKSDLFMLKSLPSSLTEESSNIQETLNVYQTIEKHERTDLIDMSFIQEFRNKLTRENRKFVTESKIKDC